MKYIQLVKHGQWDTRSLLQQVLGSSPAKAISVEEMRQRVKILNLLDEVVRIEVPVEDDQHKLISTALNSYPFGIAHKDLLAVIDGVLKAPEHSAAAKANGAAAEAAIAASA